MAEIRRRANAAPISNFRQGAPSSGGGGFALLAEAMQTAYRMLEPGAKEEMEALGDESGQDFIRANMGAIRPASIAAASSMGDHSGGGVSPRAQSALDALQADYGKLNVISGYRDPARNAKVGGAKGSQHLPGNAFDVDVAGLSQEQRTDLIRRARAAGFEGIGVYDNSLHFDVGGDRAWGPSYKRDSLPAWAAEAVGAPIGGQRVSGASSKGIVSGSGAGYPSPVTTAAIPDEKSAKAAAALTAANSKLDELLESIKPHRAAGFEPLGEGNRNLAGQENFSSGEDRRAQFDPIPSPSTPTYEQWKGMTRAARARAGLPVSPLGGRIFYSRFGPDRRTKSEIAVDEAEAKAAEWDAMRGPQPSDKRPPAAPNADRRSQFDPIEDDPRHADIRKVRLEVKRKTDELAESLQQEWRSGRGDSPRALAMERMLDGIDSELEKANAILTAAPAAQQEPKTARREPKQNIGTTVITASGKTELRLFSPLAGPLLQAHNAAARAAVGMEVLNQGELALIDMSKQFELDPQGFQQAARTYVDEVIKGLPRELRAETRQSLGQYATRRFLGMMEAKQTETRQRAANANKALVDRWGDSYAEALASGDPETIAEAQAKLDGALGLRETLPGLSWTPEQSENVRIASRKQADQIMAQQRRDAQAEVKGKLNLIIGAAKDGSQSADEGMLQDAKVKELFPDLWNEAAAWVIARDAMPEMWKMTPDELAADAAAKRAQPVTNDFQLDQLNVLDSMAKTQAKEFAEDPIKRAQQVLPGTITPLDPSSPEKFGSSLAQRFTEAMGLAGIDKDGQRTGRAYVKDPVLLSKAEADTMATLFGTETPDELRAAYAQAVVQALGPNTGLLLRQVEMDPVLRLGAQRQSVGGDPNVTLQALRGQEMLNAGLVMAPTQAATIKEVSPEIHAAIAHLPADAQSDVLSFAKAHYASQARGVDPSSDAAKELMKASINTALGQGKNPRGQVTGGVQQIGGFPTLLPVGASGEDVEAVLRRGIGSAGVGGGGTRGTGFRQFSPNAGTPADADLWTRAGAVSQPMLEGQPIKGEWFENGWVAITPHPSARNTYLMQVRIPGGGVTDVRDANGNAFMFNLPNLIEAGR